MTKSNPIMSTRYFTKTICTSEPGASIDDAIELILTDPSIDLFSITNSGSNVLLTFKQVKQTKQPRPNKRTQYEA